MKLHHSRQAWHDAYYPNIKSSNRWGLEALSSAYYPFKALSHYNEYQLAHCYLAGKVQQVITTLPKPLQHFGHYLYSPLATNYDFKISHQLILGVYHHQTLTNLNQEHQKILQDLTLIALNNYRDFVVGQKKLVKTYKKIAKQLQNSRSTVLSDQDWRKQWQSTYNQLLCLCEELEKRVLIPLDNLIRESKQQ